jgi:hypothetical protein
VLHAGEEIPLEAENARRLIAAVVELRGEAVGAPAPPADAAAEAEHSFAKAERAFRTGVAELDKLRAMPLDVGGRMRLPGFIDETTGTLKLIGLQV